MLLPGWFAYLLLVFFSYLCSILLHSVEYLDSVNQCFSNTFGRGPKKGQKILAGQCSSLMSKFVHGWDLLTGGEGANGKNFPRGPKTYFRGPQRAISSPRGPNVPIYHLLPISRGPFFFARGPFMARGPLFEKR